MGVAYSEDLLHWTEALDHPVLASRARSFDSQVVEPGPPPIITPQGIFLVYNGADDNLLYSTGWVLIDKKDPTKVLARAEKPVFGREKQGEKVGRCRMWFLSKAWSARETAGCSITAARTNMSVSQLRLSARV